MTLVLSQPVGIAWSKGPTGTKSYDILRNGKKVSSTKTALTSRITIANGDDVAIVSQPSGDKQEAKITWDAVTPPPPANLCKGLWDGNGFADIVKEADTGFNTLFTGDTSLITQMQTLKQKACMQSGVFRDETGQYSVDAATAISWAKPFHDAGLLRQLYLADEPNAAKWPNAPQTIKQRYDAFKAAYPDVEMVIGFWDGGDGSSIKPFADAKCFDACTLDIYPVNNGGYDSVSIPNVAAACDGMALKYYGVAQLFGADQWQMPSVAQMNRLFDQWEATGQAAMFGYVWGASGGSTQFQNLPDLVATVKTRLATLTVKPQMVHPSAAGMSLMSSVAVSSTAPRLPREIRQLLIES